MAALTHNETQFLNRLAIYIADLMEGNASFDEALVLGCEQLLHDDKKLISRFYTEPAISENLALSAYLKLQ